MKKISAAAVATLAVALAAPAAVANDSTATTAAGGLVLTRDAHIDMRSEDLFISPRQVRVRYVFHNTAAQDRRVTVAFPMPNRNLADEEYGNVAFPADFRTTVDGRPVRMARELRAFVGNREVTAELNRLRVPLTPGAEPSINEAGRALDALPRREQDRLVAARVAVVEEYDVGQGTQRRVLPAWTVRETWSWEQTFPARRDLVVEHQYTPGAGGSVGSILTMDDLDGDLRREQAQYRRRYCTDDAFVAAARRLAREGGESSGGLVPDLMVNYILRTGANWRAPIGRFRLVVEKPDPRVIVSFCGEGVRRISPTQFEMVRTNWRPDRDLEVLYLGPTDALYPENR